jgi:DNA-binding NtrC family response regulator
MAENIFGSKGKSENNSSQDCWKVLVVDDEKDYLDSSRDYLKDHSFNGKGFKTLTSLDLTGARQVLLDHPEIVVVILDVILQKNENGLDFIAYIKEKVNTNIQIIIRTGQPGKAPEREVVSKYPVNGYLLKASKNIDDFYTIVDTCIRNFENLIEKENQLKDKDGDILRAKIEGIIQTRFIGDDPGIKDVWRKALQAAKFADETILINGETGTGKEIIAKVIHYASKRKDGKIFPFNAAAVSESLAEGELFGWKKGSHSTAEADKKGYFELADNGTLFIDEIHQLSTNIQKKLLRAIEYKEIIPLGSESPVKVNVRLVVATNQNLEQCVKDGRLLNDLYYRLNVFNISIPPLRSREKDIPMLIDYFVKNFTDKYEWEYIPKIENSFYKAAASYDFPGNVRELENLIKRILMNAFDKKLLSESDFKNALTKPQAEPVIKNAQQAFEPLHSLSLDEALLAITHYKIMHALKNEKNHTQAAEFLKIGRTKLYRLLEEIKDNPWVYELFQI